MALPFRPSSRDIATVTMLVSRAIQVVSAAMIAPTMLAFLNQEMNAGYSLLFGASLGILITTVAQMLLKPAETIRCSHGMAASGITWLVAPALGAIPLYLSGHFPSILTAYFDAMSGLTCAGLSVMNDLDHTADSMNLWRHIMQFMGGQGIVLVVLTFFAGGGGAVGMYAGEGRTDKIMPNVRQTARFIWRASLVYTLIGTGALSITLVHGGMAWRASIFHGINLFFAAFDTGGFSPRSTSVGYYHSASVEAILIVMMVMGALSFAVHYRLWQRDGVELLKNIETRVLFITYTLFSIMLFTGLIHDEVFDGFIAPYRRGIFQLVSAHTGAGFASVPGAMFSSTWGSLASGALVLAMTVGGMSGSTTGGIKGIRIGMVAKMLGMIVRRSALPKDTYMVLGYHHIQRQRFVPDAVRAATTVLLLFLGLYFAGTVVGVFYGYPLEEALFESTSAAGGVGLSVGITSPDMEPGLMITYILQMYLGRLEFISAFSLIGYVRAMIGGNV